MRIRVALSVIAVAGGLIAAAPNPASAGPVGPIAVKPDLHNGLVQEVGRRWRRYGYYPRRFYRPYYGGYYRPYYRPYYYGAYGYPYYGPGYYRPYRYYGYGPGFYGRFYGPRFGFSIGF